MPDARSSRAATAEERHFQLRATGKLRATEVIAQVEQRMMFNIDLMLHQDHGSFHNMTMRMLHTWPLEEACRRIIQPGKPRSD